MGVGHRLLATQMTRGQDFEPRFGSKNFFWAALAAAVHQNQIKDHLTMEITNKTISKKTCHVGKLVRGN